MKENSDVPQSYQIQASNSFLKGSVLITYIFFVHKPSFFMYYNIAVLFHCTLLQCYRLFVLRCKHTNLTHVALTRYDRMWMDHDSLRVVSE